jgi:hypothetical protein
MVDLTPRATLAATLGVSDHTMRRRLNDLAARGMLLRPIGKGQRQMFTADDVALILEALRCPYTSAAGVKSGTPVAPSELVVKVSRSPSSAQERFRAQMQKPSREPKKPASVARRLKALPDGNGASA